MIYQLTIQLKAQRFLKKLKKKNPDAASEVVMDIFELKNDPKTSRPNCDIAKVRGRINEYRLRMGKARAEYTVIDNEINVTKIFIKKRKSDYR